MDRLFFVLAMVILSAGSLAGQGLEEEAALQGELTYVLEGNELVLTAQAQNTTANELIINYDFILSGTDNNNNAVSNNQDGQAKIGPEENKTLVSVRIALEGLKEFEAVLLLYYEDILMDADTLAYSAEKQQQEPEEQFEEDISQEVDYEGQESGFELGGFVIDNTRTRAGRELYDLFYSKWEAPAGAGDFFIKLEEFPGRGRITRLVAWLDDDKIVEANLQPNYDYLEGLADYLNSRFSSILRQRAEAGENLNDELQGIY
ncbi:MAG: hypothetical protein KDD19_09510 [Phaeodactylibacter sp.]|nr:hypothetical protein [Phaeodactylibacter sp.]MCB9050584.1 hypothetical protein [Lewinellaceae bacterium]